MRGVLGKRQKEEPHQLLQDDCQDICWVGKTSRQSASLPWHLLFKERRNKETHLLIFRIHRDKQKPSGPGDSPGDREGRAHEEGLGFWGSRRMVWV